MSHQKHHHKGRTEEKFALNGKFLKDEAKEALRSFVSPYVGLYAAATGKEVVLVRRKGGRFVRDKQDKKSAA